MIPFLGGEDLLLITGNLFDARNHVGLPGGEPGFADEHVLDDERVGASDCQVASFRRRLERIELDGPPALCVGGGRFLLAGELHRDVFSRISLSPDRGVHALLQDHVVPDDGGKRYLGPGCRGGGKKQEESGQAHHRFFYSTVPAGRFICFVNLL